MPSVVAPSAERRAARYARRPSQAVAERMARALRHRLLLLDRPSPNTFLVLGATSNVYTVTLSTSPSCSCPDPRAPCKHILFVLVRALDLALTDPRLWQRALLTTEVADLLARATSSAAPLAGPKTRTRFEATRVAQGHGDGVVRGRGGLCPVCFEGMDDEGEVVVCGRCRNGLHRECWGEWKRRGGRRRLRCVVCRGVWREERESGGYVNLGEEVEEEENWGGERGIEELYPETWGWIRRWQERDA
ncbi:hypothetical protein AMTRI_Chr06g171640 [Amborella trichopoda]|uniref:SWIM-type domain-containing protein n=1 Tax=Amborella trichopoda TaxID=13333 RepID=W1PIR8_AMBTC|nr:mitogen-activated protein kinase kinase kinase 1 [Amborella trichopoda]ERN09872.1 hypothetical protein AMTR_s00013p00099260 [Amborella trichopoda]|eukprot:XP_006848291.1 mitogen-activated protein kinase kinase kinase 1 [Amborella trichopoda]